jgi:hypothetical protein
VIAVKSLLNALSKRGKKPPVSIPGVFQSYPKGSLKEIIRCLELPAPNISPQQRSSTNFDADWTDEFQGLTYGYWDGAKNSAIWFFSNKTNLYKVRWNREGNLEILNNFHCNSLGPYLTQHWHHFGDIDYFDGLVLVPFESLEDNRCSVLLVLTEDLNFIGWAEIKGKYDNRNTGWCAVNSWNRMLYTSDDNAEFFYVYDISEFYDLKGRPSQWPVEATIELQNKRFKLMKPDGSQDQLSGSVQGIAFSSNGRIYASQAKVTDWLILPETEPIPIGWYNCLSCYDLLTGLCLVDKQEIEHPDSSNVAEELQGITICKQTNELYLVFLDNDAGGDEIDILNYWSIDPQNPI